MNSLMKHYWWSRIVLILRVSLVRDFRHRALVADQGEKPNDDFVITPVLFSNLMDEKDVCYLALPLW